MNADQITAKLRRIADLLNSIGSHQMAVDVTEAAEMLARMIGDGLYSIGTWDSDLQAFTPQEGCSTPWHNVDRSGLRAHLKELRSAFGYQCHRNHSDSDAAVLVERTDGKAELEVLESWKT